MKTVTALLLALALNFSGQIFATAGDTCAICSRPLPQEVFLLRGPYSTEPLMACGGCAIIRERCAICLVPLKTNYIALQDGRLLCRKDHSEAVFSTSDAYSTFNEAKRFGMRIFAGCGSAPDKNIQLFLVDRRDLEKMIRVQRFPQGRSANVGLTRSTTVAGGEWEHQVYLLNGLRPSQLQSVCVHEYTHAWLNQNLSDGRKVEVDAVEGFCELVAYNYMRELRDPFEPGLILTNGYTRGQVEVFSKAQETYQFYPLIKWMKAGIDQRVEKTNLNRFLVLTDGADAQWTGWTPQAQSAAPDRLVLKSISGTGARQFAMINNQTLQKGERAKVRVGTSNVVVKCLAILPKSAVVQVEDAPEKLELVLEEGRK